ncbi:MAG: hypothetical protein IT293_04140 [Deltaproteobacteria bacterium]|nr:hypothetical protein [Deltaproteobacteria bacterium]
MTRGLRILGVLAMALAVAHCGDSDVRVSTDGGVVPSPGRFTGFMSDGAAIRLEVGSIEEIAFTCDGEEIQETFSPPQPIDSDGTFNVKFEDGGRDFRVRGTFRDNNNVDGTVDDEDNECDTSYDATRGGIVDRTPTPAPTPTGNVVTETPISETPTPGEGEPTVTPTDGVTPGPSTSGGTTAKPTATPKPCPVAVEVEGNAGNAKVLDSGWTGLGHNATVVSDGKLTFNVACSGTTRPCGVCNVSGPIQNVNADKGDINPRRCSNDPSKKCADNSGCTSPGTCAFFFGAPLPLAAGGVTSCVVNQIRDTVSGTANVESGAFESSLKLTSKVALGLGINQPCPTCDGDPTPNDGQAGGTCNGGARNGQACDVNGKSPIPSFGSTSLDCVPTSFISNLPIDLLGSSSTETAEITSASDNCGATPGKKCLCPFDNVGVPTQPNACIDDGGTDDVDESLCLPISSGSNKGSCQNQPTVEQYCSPVETFKGCTSNADCPVAGDTCKVADRPCFLDNGVVGGKVTAVGKADPPDANGASNPTFAALFCIPPVQALAINQAAGLPGPGRIQLPLSSKEILSLP